MAKTPKANMNFLLEEISPSKNQDSLAALKRAGKYFRSGPGGYSTRSSNAFESQQSVLASTDPVRTKPKATPKVTKVPKSTNSIPSFAKSQKDSTYKDAAIFPNLTRREKPRQSTISHNSGHAPEESNTSQKHRSAVSSEDIKHALSIGHKEEERKVPNPTIKQQSKSRSSAMSSSQRNNRQQRNGPRGHDDHDLGEQSMWNEALNLLKDVEKDEKKANEMKEKIFDAEKKLGAKKAAGEAISVQELEAHDIQLREFVRASDAQAAKLRDDQDVNKVKHILELLIDIQKNKEKDAIGSAEPTGPGRASRAPGVEYEGPSDSPAPNPERPRKMGASRTSSQAPKPSAEGKSDTAPSESSERASKPKVTYKTTEKVAFKCKGKQEEHVWILGEVVRVIGEGKSRRYEVLDLFPEPGGPKLYKSSASQMVSIPREDTKLEDYEVGRNVLALYPGTSAFYRAQVKGMLKDGSEVQLLFEDEVEDKIMTVERRFVLDHKG